MSAYETAFASGMLLILVIIGIMALVGYVLGYRSLERDYIGGPMG